MDRSPKRIILVDDDPGIRDAVRIMMETKGYTVELMSDGQPLLDGHFEHPDLFILDKQLPGVDGLAICRYLKSLPGTQRIPILMMSASPQIRPLALAACADGFLEKPFRMQDLRSLVEELIG